MEEGKQLYRNLILLAMGVKKPDRDNAYEWITYDIFASMRACDKKLTDQMLRQALVCITAQVGDVRLNCTKQDQVIAQRIKEGGCAEVKYREYYSPNSAPNIDKFRYQAKSQQ